jgi:hypothetical protein
MRQRPSYPSTALPRNLPPLRLREGKPFKCHVYFHPAMSTSRHPVVLILAMPGLC